MANNRPKIWDELKIPKNIQEMGCQALVAKYQQTKDPSLIAWMIKKEDGPKRELAAVVFNILKETDATIEIFHDLFDRLRQRLLTYDKSINNCKAWFKTVFRNRALDMIKARKKESSLDEVSYAQTKGDGLSPEDIAQKKLDGQQKIEEMKRAIEGIQDGWKIIELRIKGIDYTACAKQLNLSFTQFRGRYQRADRILKKQFGADYPKYFYWVKELEALQ